MDSVKLFYILFGIIIISSCLFFVRVLSRKSILSRKSSEKEVDLNFLCPNTGKKIKVSPKTVFTKHYGDFEITLYVECPCKDKYHEVRFPVQFSLDAHNTAVNTERKKLRESTPLALQ